MARRNGKQCLETVDRRRQLGRSGLFPDRPATGNKRYPPDDGTDTGAIVVSTPQEVALADARKGISMFTGEKINVPVLGLVENMSWFTPAELPENKYYLFGKEGGKRLAEELNIPLLGQIPIVQSICEGGDSGKPVALNPDSITGQAFQKLAENVVKQIDYRNEHLDPTKRVVVTKK